MPFNCLHKLRVYCSDKLCLLLLTASSKMIWMHYACYFKDDPGGCPMLHLSLCMQPVSESETDEDPPQQTNLSALPDRIGFIGAGQVLHAVCACQWSACNCNIHTSFCIVKRNANPQAAVQMGEALIRGFCKSGVSSVEQISASVRSFDRQRALSALGLRVYGNALDGGAADLAANSEIIFLGVSKTGFRGMMSPSMVRLFS